MPLSVPAAHLPCPLCTFSLFLWGGVPSYLLRAVLMVFVKEHAFPDPTPCPCPCGFQERNLVSEGGAANENRSLSVSQASTSIPVQSALVKGAPTEVLCVGECTPLLYTLFLSLRWQGSLCGGRGIVEGYFGWLGRWEETWLQ